MKQAKITKRLVALTDIDGIVECLPKESADNAKRQLRKPLLNALDVYDKNVSKGRVIEDVLQKFEIDMWYQDICDLKDSAFKVIPNPIDKYKGA